jgi:hypothetical protein
MFVKHTPTGVLHVARLYENPTPAELKKAGQAHGEPRHVLRKGKIGAKRRRRGIWQYDLDDDNQIFFTCPWCGTIGRTNSENVGLANSESIWCGRMFLDGKTVKGCNRHLSLFYMDRPKLGASLNEF